MNTTRWAPFCGTVALLAQALLFQGCGGSNNPATGGTGGTTATATGGTTSSGTGGTTSAGTGGTTSSGTGGTTTTATGGSPGQAGGQSGSAGASGTAGPMACGVASSGAVKTKNACTSTDPTGCSNTCGPEKSGYKVETCTIPAGSTMGTYTEGPCMFDQSKSYTCFKVPAAGGAFSTMCPTDTITAGSPCAIPDCVTCGPSYNDSSGASKTGYCVCQAGATNPTWSCASTTAWPCPSSTGC